MADDDSHILICAESPSSVACARRLIQEYVVWLDRNLDFQDFEAEMDGLPGSYAAPDGGLWLLISAASRDFTDPSDAIDIDRVAGVIALRPLNTTLNKTLCTSSAEVKRLWVRPAFRGQGLGEVLVRHAIREATRMGYRFLFLDTLAHMSAAISLYRRMGFVDCAPYYRNPYPDVVYLSRALTADVA